jgi:hypothetical protein
MTIGPAEPGNVWSSEDSRGPFGIERGAVLEHLVADQDLLPEARPDRLQRGSMASSRRSSAGSGIPSRLSPATPECARAGGDRLRFFAREEHASTGGSTSSAVARAICQGNASPPLMIVAPPLTRAVQVSRTASSGRFGSTAVEDTATVSDARSRSAHRSDDTNGTSLSATSTRA